jgi:hypothetical protein
MCAPPFAGGAHNTTRRRADRVGHDLPQRQARARRAWPRTATHDQAAQPPARKPASQGCRPDNNRPPADRPPYIPGLQRPTLVPHLRPRSVPSWSASRRARYVRVAMRRATGLVHAVGALVALGLSACGSSGTSADRATRASIPAPLPAVSTAATTGTHPRPKPKSTPTQTPAPQHPSTGGKPATRFDPQSVSTTALIEDYARKHGGKYGVRSVTSVTCNYTSKATVGSNLGYFYTCAYGGSQIAIVGYVPATHNFL